ncbi:MAG TPA: alpha/beta fold hydrolase [Candidatus Saccharimonadales bacterium]|nr:alpha/beta fold hydrolase [Candidatus Saccharimonadales bacterium]
MEAKNIKIITPQKIILQGFIFGSRRVKTIYILLHGLSGNLFSRLELVEKMTADGAAVMVFNNRGHGLINQFRKINPRQSDIYDSLIIGEAHEAFADCIDDIDGAINTALDNGYRKIILLGHSTGCNKIAYYLSKKNPASVLGAILLAPMSDYADAIKFTEPKIFQRALKTARKLVADGKSQTLLPEKYWSRPISAQRFLSLFTPESVEEMFSYAVPNKKSQILQKIKKPFLVVLAGADQFTDRPMMEVLAWFKKVLINKNTELLMIKKSLHSFSGQETKLKNLIFKFVKSLG